MPPVKIGGFNSILAGVLFNFGFVCTLPSWLNEKEEKVYIYIYIYIYYPFFRKTTKLFPPTVTLRETYFDFHNFLSGALLLARL